MEEGNEIKKPLPEVSDRSLVIVRGKTVTNSFRTFDRL